MTKRKRFQKTGIRKVFTALLAACLLLLSAPVTGLLGLTLTANGASTTGILLTLNDGGASYSVLGANIKLRGAIGIPAEYNGLPITVIKANAFSGCASITYVTIPNSVTSIENDAFSGCTALTSITIPSSVTSMGSYLFSGCTALAEINVDSANSEYSSDGGVLLDADKTRVIMCPQGKSGEYTVPQSVIYINGYAFKDCTKLTSVTLSANTEEINGSAFWNCTGLTSVDIPDSVTTVGSYMFYGCTGLTSVTLGSSVEMIYDYAFSGCTALTSVTIKGYLTDIGNGAFSDCTALQSFTIPDSVNTIGDGAFAGCAGLTSVMVPSSVMSMDGGAFSNCPGLTQINVAFGNFYFTSEDGVLFNADKSIIVKYPAGRSGEYSIPSSVTKIGDSAFLDCNGLTSVVIPDSVTRIEYGAFYGCCGLTDIAIPNRVAFIGGSAFRSCSMLTSVTIPDSVTTISYNMFENCFNLSSVTIPAAVNAIEFRAFKGCSSLTQLNISAGNNSFSFADGLLFNKNKTATQLCLPGVRGELKIPDSVATIGAATFNGCTGITSITIPNSVKTIDNSAFCGCTGLTSVTIPDSVTTIGCFAFENCRFLKSVTLGNSVTSINLDAFSNCKALTSFTIGSSVTSIAPGVFKNCFSLENINVDAANSTYCSVDGVVFNKDKTAILMCPAGKSGTYTIPDSVTSIGDYAFYSCEDLTCVKIPNSVVNIGDSAFVGCSGLSSLTIPDSVSMIHYYSFGDNKTVIIGNTGSYAELYAYLYRLDFCVPGSITVPAGLTVKKGCVYGIRCGTTLEDALMQFNSKDSVGVFDKENYRIMDMQTIVVTGMQMVRLNSEKMVTETFVVSVLGDTDGDGKVTTSDAREALRAAAQLTVLSDAQRLAAEIDGDPSAISTSDARILLRVAARLESF